MLSKAGLEKKMSDLILSKFLKKKKMDLSCSFFDIKNSTMITAIMIMVLKIIILVIIIRMIVILIIIITIMLLIIMMIEMIFL